MIRITATSQQPCWEPWTLGRLNYEHSILLGISIDHSTNATYTSALNSYLTFCKIHGLPVDPTPQTLSYYITFQSFFINPKSVDSYLSGICNQLEPYFPDIRKKKLNHTPSYTHTSQGKTTSGNSYQPQIPTHSCRPENGIRWPRFFHLSWWPPLCYTTECWLLGPPAPQRTYITQQCQPSQLQENHDVFLAGMVDQCLCILAPYL